MPETEPALDAATAAEADWLRWVQARDASVSRPHGPLALVATHWLSDESGGAPGERFEGVPGLWAAAGRRVRVRAEASEALLLDGSAVDGERLLNPDLAEDPDILLHGERKLVPIVRDGVLALRVYDPDSAGRLAFAGIDRYAYDPALVLTARFEPYVHGHVEQVLNADGRERGMELDGDVVFDLGDDEYRLAATRDGAVLSITFGDATNGPDTFGFRQLAVRTPQAGTGAIVVDFNRATLPPCAFSDHFICPVPPVGNRLPVAIEGGEMRRREQS
ncbi:DUF1684 domain-containing protein [Catenulispora subtropica]|uniref:DUF1684 domain-containing protein n=1 Tax=Catenulispora subtropica TaxID=450798 RepID=A0ABP5BQ38_9ACTN